MKKHKRRFQNAVNSSSTSSVKVFRWRYLIVSILVFLPFSIGLLVQMYRWQVVGHEYYTEVAQSQYLVDQRLPTSRGVIYAADGTVLAVDEPVWGVYASVSSDERERETFDENRDEYISKVSEILGLEVDDLEKNLTEDFRYVLLKHNVSADDKKSLEQTNLFGFHFEKEEKRIYPDGKLACHVLGFVGKDEDGQDVGRYGLEGYYAGDLLGQEGFKYEEKDQHGNVIMTGEYDPVIPRQGKNIVLTIQPAIQAKLEAALEQGVKDYDATNGSVVVLDPSTGAIIAMANYPNYDPNYYWKEDDSDVYKNLVISDVYEYGSVNKALTISMALEEEVITPETICSDSTGSIHVLDRIIYTWDKGADGDLLPVDILKKSNNVCAVQTGLKVGIEKNYEYLRKFGIGDFVGIGLEDEATSYLKPLEMWNELDLAVCAFGQMISATPLQIASAFAAIANDGVRMRPYIVSELYDDNETITIEPEVASRPISSETAMQVREMLKLVVEDGEAKWWFDEISEYSVGGKTGTAQIPYEDKYGYYDDRTICTFVGFSPVHEAKFVMLARLYEPKTASYSAETVVPVWIELFKDITVDFGIAPES